MATQRPGARAKPPIQNAKRLVSSDHRRLKKMFSYHPMTLIRAFLLLFVAAEFVIVIVLLAQGIASLIPVVLRAASFVCSLVSITPQ